MYLINEEKWKIEYNQIKSERKVDDGSMRRSLVWYLHAHITHRRFQYRLWNWLLTKYERLVRKEFICLNVGERESLGVGMVWIQITKLQKSKLFVEWVMSTAWFLNFEAQTVFFKPNNLGMYIMLGREAKRLGMNNKLAQLTSAGRFVGKK